MILFFKDKYDFLSNFYKSPIKLNNRIFPTAEHLYQSCKSNDQKIWDEIISIESPGKVKRYSRKIQLIPKWDLKKFSIMFNVVSEKFKQNPDLQEKLIKTYKRFLVEGNHWHDNYWGQCYCEKCKNKIGQNNLGRILMEIRNVYLHPHTD